MADINSDEKYTIPKIETNYGKIKVKENKKDYYNNYYHTKKNYIECSCGCMINKCKMYAHLKTKKHHNLFELKNNNILIDKNRYYNIKQ